MRAAAIVLAVEALAVITTENVGLEALAVLLEAVALLAVASSAVLARQSGIRVILCLLEHREADDDTYRQRKRKSR